MNITEQTLIEALELLEAGQTPEAVLQRYPDSAAELRLILATVTTLETIPLQPSIAAEQKSLSTLLAAAKVAQPQRKRTGLAGMLLRPVLAILAVGVLGVGMLAAVSGDALPGDSLYVPKRWVEGSRLTFSSDPEVQAQLREEFRQERQDEVKALLAIGRETEVAFIGRIEALSSGTWQVSGIPVAVDDSTRLDGTAMEGRLIAVEGRTGKKVVTARSITVLDGLPEAPNLPEATRTSDNTTLPALVPPVSQSTPIPTQTTAPPTPIVTEEPDELEGNSVGGIRDSNEGASTAPVPSRDSSDSANEDSNGNDSEDSPDDASNGSGIDNSDDSSNDGNDDSGDDGNNDSSDDDSDDSGDDGSDDSGDDDNDDSGDDGGDDSGDDGSDDSSEEQAGGD